MRKRKGIWIGILVLIFLPLLMGAKGCLSGKTSGPNNSQGYYSCHHLERLWERAGGSSSTAEMAASIAMAESSGDPGSTDTADVHGQDEGLWQINTYYHPDLATYSPKANARAAVIISNNGNNWSAWVTYTNGSYVGQC